MTTISFNDDALKLFETFIKERRNALTSDVAKLSIVRQQIADHLTIVESQLSDLNKSLENIAELAEQIPF